MRKLCNSKYTLWALSILSFIGTIANDMAQTEANKQFATVEIILDDTSMLHSGSIHLSLCKNGVNSEFTFDNDNVDYPVTQYKTKLLIPLSAVVTYGRILFLDSKQKPLPSLDQDNNLFILQPGDEVVLHLSRRGESVIFTGKSAGKYTCLYKISNSNAIAWEAKYNAIMQEKDFAGAFAYKKFQLDSVYALQLAILHRFRKKMDPEVYGLVSLDCWGNYNRRLVDVYLTPFILGQSAEYPAARNGFDRYYRDWKEAGFKDTALLVSSYRYGDFLAEKERASAIIENSKDGKSFYPELTFGDINKAIEEHYPNGVLKDKVRLLSFYRVDRRRQGDFAHYLDAAIGEARNTVFKSKLIAFRNANGFQAEAFPFALPDKNGKIYRLSDLKGKLVIMDFWFTGCHGCVGMGAALKPIVSFYQSNPFIVFVSIGIDRSRDLWLKSVEQGQYCGKEEINLLAGMDRESSIYQHYNLQGCPTLIVVSKEGKIISTAPPDPRLDAVTFKAFIDQYL